MRINLSINPSYLCNFRCGFCYLKIEDLKDRRCLDLKSLSDKLRQLSEFGYEIDQVDLYGGEIGLLPSDYLYTIKNIVATYTPTPINVITNLSVLNPFFLDDDIDISVSFDFEAREKSDLVLQNILGLPKPISILMLASPKLMSMDVESMITTFNSLSHVLSVEIKPYSKNQSNQLASTFNDFEYFVKKWISSPLKKNFTFVNDLLIQDVLDRKRNAFSSDHLYITPSGQFAVLEFDKNDNEFFMELANLSDYQNWVKLERARVQSNSFCSNCNFLGRCLTEHYRNVAEVTNSCNGFRHLLEWAESHWPVDRQEQRNYELENSRS